jgi:hypothetical protein
MSKQKPRREEEKRQTTNEKWLGETLLDGDAALGFECRCTQRSAESQDFKYAPRLPLE